jgi:hypothetical protein
VWGLEIANAILVGERKKRLRQPEIRRFYVVAGMSFSDLSIRHAAPLATLDLRLQKAAKQAGVNIFAGESI